MKPGISTACLYPEYTETALRALCSIGVDCVEIFANCDYEIAPAYCRELRDIADSAGTAITAVHPYTSGIEPMLFFSMYDRRFDQGRSYYKRVYEAAATLGAGIIVFHGGTFGYITDYDMYFDRLGILMSDARAAGVELCHENVSRCVGRSPDFFNGLLEAYPDAGIVFDLKQALRSGYDPIEFARPLLKNIRHIHLSDHDGEHDCLSPGKGIFNIAQFLLAMAKTGYNRSIIVELYRENFGDVVELSAGYQHLSEIISTIK